MQIAMGQTEPQAGEQWDKGSYINARTSGVLSKTGDGGRETA